MSFQWTRYIISTNRLIHFLIMNTAVAIIAKTKMVTAMIRPIISDIISSSVVVGASVVSLSDSPSVEPAWLVEGVEDFDDRILEFVGGTEVNDFHVERIVLLVTSFVVT